MKEVEKENGETFIEDEVTLRLCFPKEWCSMTKGDIQKMLNKYIEDEWRIHQLTEVKEKYKK